MPLVLIFLFAIIAAVYNTIAYLNDFSYNVFLERSLDVVVLVKSFEQRAKNQRIKARPWRGMNASSKKSVKPRGGMNAHRGMFFQTDLRRDYWDQGTEFQWKIYAPEMYSLAWHGDLLAVTFSDHVGVFNVVDGHSFKIQHPLFKKLHQINFNKDGSKLLILSSHMDFVVEYDIWKREISWEWWCWEHGGYGKHEGGWHITRNRTLAMELMLKGELVYFVDVKNFQEGTGVPIQHRTCHPNAALYSQDEKEVYLSLGIAGQIVKVDMKTKEPEVVIEVTPFQHAFQRAWGNNSKYTFYQINTLEGRVLWYDENHEKVLEISIEHLGNVTKGREGVGEWGQWVTQIKQNLYTIADVHRNMVHIVDIEKREYRSIKYQIDWAVQDVVVVPQRFSEFLKKYSYDIKPKPLPHSSVPPVPEKQKVVFKSLILSPSEELYLKYMKRGVLHPFNSGFMSELDYDNVLEHFRLSSGFLWPLPIMKSISSEVKEGLTAGDTVFLVSGQTNSMLGVMKVDQIFKHGPYRHSVLAYGNSNASNSNVAAVFDMGRWFVSGDIVLVDAVEKGSSQVEKFLENHVGEDVGCLLKFDETLLKLVLEDADLWLIPSYFDKKYNNKVYGVECDLLNQDPSFRHYIMQIIMLKNLGCKHLALDNDFEKFLENEIELIDNFEGGLTSMLDEIGIEILPREVSQNNERRTSLDYWMHTEWLLSEFSFPKF